MAVYNNDPTWQHRTYGGAMPAQFERPAAEAGAYYYCDQDVVLTPLDEEMEEPLRAPKGTAIYCERVDVRPKSLIGMHDQRYTHTDYYLTFRVLDPYEAGKVLRAGFYYSGPDSIRGFTKIDEPLVVLALVGAGLAP